MSTALTISNKGTFYQWQYMPNAMTLSARGSLLGHSKASLVEYARLPLIQAIQHEDPELGTANDRSKLLRLASSQTRMFR